MNINEMHYEFKLQANKLDSQKTRNVIPAQIDWLLNSASLIELQKRYTPYNGIQKGAEAIHKRTMDLASLHIPTHQEPPLIPTVVDDFYGNVYSVNLSEATKPILYLTEAYATISKSGCGSRLVGMDEMQTADLGEALMQSHYKPSFKWRKVPFRVAYSGESDANPHAIYVYTNDDFTVDDIRIGYYKYPAKVFFSGYGSLDGVYASGDPQVDSDLPESIHRNIVNTAVQLFFANLQDKEYLQLAIEHNKLIEY